MASLQSHEKALGGRPIPLGLWIHINDLSFLIYGPPQIVLLAIDLCEDLVDIECITMSLVPRFQTPGIDGSELDAPEANGLVADSDTTLGQEILDIAVAQIEAVVGQTA